MNKFSIELVTLLGLLLLSTQSISGLPIRLYKQYLKIFYALKTQFDLVLIEQGSNKLGIIKISANIFNKREFTKIIADFENEAYQKHNIKYTFIGKKDFITQSHNFADILKNARRNLWRGSKKWVSDWYY